MERAGSSAPLAYALVLHYLGDYYMALEQWSDAEKQYRRALVMREQALGPSPLVAQSMICLSRVLEKLHRKNEAKDYKAQVRVILGSQNNPAYSGQTVDISSFRKK